MSRSVEFYFDFSSSYSYVALAAVKRLADEYDCSIEWKPIALGAIFKTRNHAPPHADDPKHDYIRRDVERCAAEAGLEYTWPDPFPFNSIPVARVFYAIARDDPDQAKEWALAVFNASFREGRNCSDPAEIVAIAGKLNLDVDALVQATQEDSVKQLLKDATDEAAEKGVFGAPTFFVDGNMFWGADRLDRVERLLQ